MLWILNRSDGDNDLLEIAAKSSIPFDTITGAAIALRDQGLVVEA